MKKRIMVVDDDKEFLQEFCETLEENGYETTSVDSSVKFFSTIRRTKPDLILLDLKMPHKNGLELLVSMDYYPEYCHAPVMFMSAHFRDENVSIFDMFDVRGCFKKPFHMEEVIPSINEVLEET